jgi:hypothetical protein
MLYLESFVHRGALAEVVSRWIVNQPRPGDVAELKRIVNFNSYIARIWGDKLAQDILTHLHGRAPNSFIAKYKGGLKDFVAQNPHKSTPRIQELFERYKRYPELFFRETPYDGRIYHLDRGGEQTYVGSTRIKRFRRIAEKGSRRIVEYLFQRIRANADAFAEERARSLGIPKANLITPREEMVQEFEHAERRLMQHIRQGTVQHEFPILSIPDVFGLKLITDDKQLEQLIAMLQASPDCRLIEQEHHTGRYNAINLKLSYRLPRQELLDNPPAGRQLDVFDYRGISRDRIQQEYVDFVESAEDHVFVEIICSSYDEFLESELGRSMHEDRIMRQRRNPEYDDSGLANNATYLMDYILSLCLAPTTAEVTDVPIKLWVKYMPDTFDRLTRRLFQLPVDASFDAFPPKVFSHPTIARFPEIDALKAAEGQN